MTQTKQKNGGKYMGMPAVEIEYVCAPMFQPQKRKPLLVLLPPYSKKQEKLRRKKLFKRLKLIADGVAITVQAFVYFVMMCTVACGIATWFCVNSVETLVVASLITPMIIGVICILVGYVIELRVKQRIIKRTRRLFDIQRLCVYMIYTLIRNTVMATAWFMPLIEYILTTQSIL